MRRRLAIATAFLLLPLLAAAGLAERGDLAVQAAEPAFVLEPLPPQAWRAAFAEQPAQGASDITARRVQTDFTRISAEITEAAWEVTLANAADRPATVTLRESFGGEWLVVDETIRHDKEDAVTAAWTVTVPARGETVVRYRVRVKG